MAKRILLIDDSPIVREAYSLMLVDAGYEVATRAGVEDMDAQSTDGFDLILMDVQMPNLFGDDVACVIRNVRGVKTPIYLVSVLPEEELRRRVADAGVDGFISKSGGTDHVVERVKNILG